MRLGFPVSVHAQPNLRSHDARRVHVDRGTQPHLSVGLAYVRDIFRFLARTDIHFYRLSSKLALRDASFSEVNFQSQLDECAAELRHTGELARQANIRLSLHADASIVLNANENALKISSQQRLRDLADFLDRLEVGPSAVIVVHVGGLYAAKTDALARFCHAWRGLPASVQARLALEHDDDRFSLADTLWIHREIGIPLVFDRLHHLVFNPDGLDEFEALRLALSTWPRGVRPKVHFSSPRTAFNDVFVPDADHNRRRVLRPPRWTQHADYINPFEFADWLRRARALGLPDFDVMLEARARDLALLRLRSDLRQYAPELIESF